MPIKVPDHLPAKEILLAEHIFAMDESVAFKQDIRALKIAIINLMPIKQTTEVQLLRMLGNTPLQVDITLIHMQSHVSKNTSPEYLAAFYHVFRDIKHQRYDGMIITGAPVESLPFEQVSYWRELTEILEWSKTHVTSTFNICWGAQASLYYHYGVPKYELPRKMFGIFAHNKTRANVDILRGFDDVFFAPHSRHTEIKREDILNVPDLEILSESDEAGVYIAASRDGRNIFVTGHSEYDPLTLQQEYERDLAKGLTIDAPLHYNPAQVNWRAHGGQLYSNWLNYYVYQQTPYEL